MFDPTIVPVKCGKGENICADEKRQLILSFLTIFQDPICGNGQQSVTYWERIVDLQQTSLLKAHNDQHKV